MKIIWCMVPEIWSTTVFFIILGHFIQLTTRKITILKKWKKHLENITLKLCTTNDGHMTYNSWDMECDQQNFCHFGPFFAHLHQNFEMKKLPKDITILHMCTRNGNHMYGSWDIKCNRQNCLLFWVIFCPITPLTILKIKLLKKSSFTHFTPLLEKAWSYAVLFLRYHTWQKKCIFKFGLFFDLLPP